MNKTDKIKIYELLAEIDAFDIHISLYEHRSQFRDKLMDLRERLKKIL